MPEFSINSVAGRKIGYKTLRGLYGQLKRMNASLLKENKGKRQPLRIRVEIELPIKY